MVYVFAIFPQCRSDPKGFNIFFHAGGVGTFVPKKHGYRSVLLSCLVVSKSLCGVKQRLAFYSPS